VSFRSMWIAWELAGSPAVIDSLLFTANTATTVRATCFLNNSPVVQVCHIAFY
jgi:hypothetical protein